MIIFRCISHPNLKSSEQLKMMRNNNRFPNQHPNTFRLCLTLPTSASLPVSQDSKLPSPFQPHPHQGMQNLSFNPCPPTISTSHPEEILKPLSHSPQHPLHVVCDWPTECIIPVPPLNKYYITLKRTTMQEETGTSPLLASILAKQQC